MRWRTPAERESTFDTMIEIAVEIDALTCEAQRLERTLRADDWCQQS